MGLFAGPAARSSQIRIGLKSRLATSYGVNDKAPTYVVVDPDGKIVSVGNDLREAATDITETLDTP